MLDDDDYDEQHRHHHHLHHLGSSDDMINEHYYDVPEVRADLVPHSLYVFVLPMIGREQAESWASQIGAQKFLSLSVLRIRIRDPVHGWEKSVSGIRDEHLKIPKFFDADPGSIRPGIWDGGNKHPESAKLLSVRLFSCWKLGLGMGFLV